MTPGLVIEWIGCGCACLAMLLASVWAAMLTLSGACSMWTKAMRELRREREVAEAKDRMPIWSVEVERRWGESWIDYGKRMDARRELERS